MATVTIVVATYNRPQSLKHTVASILAQTYQDWVLLVVGDKCSEETVALMARYEDERIVYLNLDERCGEQSGPNSVGFVLAKSKYVAFANHDDIWLEDHLERALQVMVGSDIEFYCAGTALTAFATDMTTNEQRPVVWETSPAVRSLSEAYYNSTVLFEPISCWVVKRRLLSKVGVWRPAGQIYRTPLVDWVLRAWRAGVSCHFSSVPTVIYCNAEKRGMGNAGDGKGLYFNKRSEGAYWLEKFAGWPVDKIRSFIEKEEKSASRTRTWTFYSRPYENREFFWIFEALLTPQTAEVFRQKGWDGFNQACKLLDFEKGATLARMLTSRTGEVLMRRQSWKPVVEKAQKRIESNERWQRANGGV